MALGHATNKFEGAKGIEAKTAELAQDVGIMLLDRLCDSLGVAFL